MNSTIRSHPALVTEYAAYTNQGFLLREMTVSAALLLRGYSIDDLKMQVLEQNAFQLPSQQSRKTILTAVVQRLEDASEELLESLAEGSLDLRRLTNFYLILLKHRLLREFMAEVVREEVLRFSQVVSRAEIASFFERKRAQVETIATWSEPTLRKCKNNVQTMCSDAGLMTSLGAGNYRIVPQIVPAKLRQMLKQADRQALLPLLLDQGGR
jgi:hypothetical protein